MKLEELVRTTKLTVAEIQQLRSYVTQAEVDGWYYGTKKHFDDRHQEIKRFLDMPDDKANDQ